MIKMPSIRRDANELGTKIMTCRLTIREQRTNADNVILDGDSTNIFQDSIILG